MTTQAGGWCQRCAGTIATMPVWCVQVGNVYVCVMVQVGNVRKCTCVVCEGVWYEEVGVCVCVTCDV